MIEDCATVQYQKKRRQEKCWYWCIRDVSLVVAHARCGSNIVILFCCSEINAVREMLPNMEAGNGNHIH